jgi:hypothetical protein
LPSASSAIPGSEASWLEPLFRGVASTEIILARTAHVLLICKGDVGRVTTLYRAIPFERIVRIETAHIRFLHGARVVLGFTFDDGSSIAVMSPAALDDVVRRFCAPLIDRRQP